MHKNINKFEESEVTLNFLREPDHENYSMVVDEYLSLIRKVAYRIVMNDHDADDIAQETFISAYQNIEKFKRNAKFKTWLCKITHNKAYSFLRAKKSRFDSAIELKSESLSAKYHQPDSRMKTNEAHDKIHTAISELPDHLRTAIVLIAIDEIPIDEAVYILKCSKATIYWRVHKARKILKEVLGRSASPIIS